MAKNPDKNISSKELLAKIEKLKKFDKIVKLILEDKSFINALKNGTIETPAHREKAKRVKALAFYERAKD